MVDAMDNLRMSFGSPQARDDAQGDSAKAEVEEQLKVRASPMQRDCRRTGAGRGVAVSSRRAGTRRGVRP